MAKTPPLSYLILGLSILTVLALKLDYLPLIFEEPRRALVSLEMILSGNYVVPRINGFEYYNKPPFYNWILAAFFQLFGSHEWVVRLPAYLSLFAIAGINYRFFRDRIGGQPALISSFFFLLSGHVLFYFSFIGEIDITYSLIVYSQAVVFFYFHDKEKLWAMFGWSHALMTIGFMTKGLPSIAFQGLTIIGFAIYYRKWMYLFHPANFLFLVLCLLCLFSYFSVYANHSDPIPYLAQLVNESSKRTSLDTISVLTNPFRVVGEFLKITFPWCLLTFPLLFKHNRQSANNRWITFGLLFVIANVWLYLLSTGTRDRYLYMFLPFIYNSIAYYFLPIGSHHKSIKRGVSAFAILLSLLFGYLSFDLKTSIWWPLFFSLLFAIVVFFLVRNKSSAILSLFVLMLLARLAYDQIVFPERRDAVGQKSAKSVAKKIVDITGSGSSLNFYTSFSSKENQLPLVGKFEVPRIERLPYDLSFYVSRMSGGIIRASDKLKNDFWYVTRKENVQDQYEIALEFRLEKKDWVLFTK